MARMFGLEVIRMACADVLPYDYEEYGKEVIAYLDTAQKKAQSNFGEHAPSFADAATAAKRFQQAGAKIVAKQKIAEGDPAKLNKALLETERALLIPEGLPNRKWYHHSIYAPGEYTGYAAVVIPGVNEALDKHDLARSQQQIEAVAEALNRAAKVLESYR
jgi:N-acetylated-alpha-linked acidic dipeptidase